MDTEYTGNTACDTRCGHIESTETPLYTDADVERVAVALHRARFGEEDVDAGVMDGPWEELEYEAVSALEAFGAVRCCGKAGVSEQARRKRVRVPVAE